jgi:adhesin transport system membrane fusion protein
MNDLRPPLPADPGDVSRGTHLFVVFMVTLVATLALWSYYGRLDIVSVAGGEVVPASQVKTVQHLEGGIVRKIHVKEGEGVKANQPLLDMESTVIGADVIDLKDRITRLAIKIKRLEAEATEADVIRFSPAVLEANRGQVSEAIRTFNSRRDRLVSQITTQSEIIAQRGQDIREIIARLRNRRNTLKLLSEQVKISEDLLKTELTNRYKHLDLLKEASRLKGSIEEDKVALERARAALKEVQSKLENIHTSFIEEASLELESARRQMEELAPRLAKHQDSLKRTVLRSPVDGVVKTLHVVTIGGVLKPGDKVVDIVPAGDRLVIEAKLPTQDIGYVHKGQQAVIRLASADAMRFDSLTGTVANVSPDTVLTEDGQPFYKVRIETQHDHFQRGAIRYNLFPGMQVVTSINTGERSVLEYLFDPFLANFSLAFRER